MGDIKQPRATAGYRTQDIIRTKNRYRYARIFDESVRTCTDIGEFSMSQRVRMRKIFEPEKSLASKICVRMRKDMVPRRFWNGTPASPISVRRSSCRIRILQPVRRTRTSRITCIIAYRDIYAYRDGIAVCLHREVITCRQHRD
jgi:hypothetical protein